RLAERADFQPARLNALQVDAGSAQAVRRVHKQLSRKVGNDTARPASPELVEQALLLSVLAGFPDRIARRRKPNAPEVLLVGGIPGTLDPASVVHEPELLIALDAEEQAAGRGVRVRLA